MKVSYDIPRMIEDLKEYLHEKNITQSEFSAISGVSPSAVSRFLNNVGTPYAFNVAKIAKAIGKSLDDYSIGSVAVYKVDGDVYWNMSLDELNSFIQGLINIRDVKIQKEFERIEAEMNELSNRREEVKKMRMVK